MGQYDYTGTTGYTNYGGSNRTGTIGNEASRSSTDRNYDRNGIATEETNSLIASDKVEGTRVYDRNGERIGSINNFMVDKRSGRVEYAVLSFGGFLGMGGTYYPLPWKMLDYDTDLGGFRVDMDEDDLDEAPSYRAGSEPDFSDDRYGRMVHGYYGMAY